jgi:excisionase family DNA binding protein
MATEMAVGLAMAQQMMQQGLTPPAAPKPSGEGGKPATNAAGEGGPHALPELLSPGDVANALKVSEGDVLAILDSGELIGKKIGSTWRIKRSALNEYLAK